jgi:bifunctional DNA-binding transcriptional regulator/antitoxin component of YhaV-PrlF toxin-antitoxin module
MRRRAKLNEQGRLVIPLECREAAGMKLGMEVLVEVVGKGELRLRTKGQAIHVAQEIVARHVSKGRDLVGELIVERRNEAARR